MTPLAASLYSGDVGHMRHGPRRHSLRYPVLSLLIDIDGTHRQQARAFGFSLDRWNLVSHHTADHGDGRDLRSWVNRKLAEAGIAPASGRIQVLASPRMLGAVFNPLSAFFCHDTAGHLTAMLFEVSNFHGGRGVYAFAVPAAQDEQAPLRFSCEKTFFVSPFNPVEGRYTFKVDRDGDTYRLAIRLHRDGQCIMGAIHSANRQDLTSGAIARAAGLVPLNTMTTVGGILLEALRLRLKGLRTHAPRRGTVDTMPRRL